MKETNSSVTDPATGKVCGLAALSQLLGFLTLTIVLAPVTAIPAIICGHIALAKIRRSKGALTGSELAMRGLALGYLSAVLLAIIIPTTASVIGRVADAAREKAVRGKCRDHLTQISIFMAAYGQHNAGRGPADLASLERYGAKPDLFVCPAGSRTPGEMGSVMQWSDYIYRRDGLAVLGPEQHVMAYCRPENHRGKGSNLLLSDGNVMWMNSEDLQKILSEGQPPASMAPRPSTRAPAPPEPTVETNELGEASR